MPTAVSSMQLTYQSMGNELMTAAVRLISAAKKTMIVMVIQRPSDPQDFNHFELL